MLNVGQMVSELRRMTVSELRRKYANVFGEQTRSHHKDYLIRRIAWRMQANAEGGIPERTIRRWLGRDEFKRAYREARREAFAQAVSLTQRYAPLAVQALAPIIADESAPAGARVQAAIAVLRFTRESIELDELVERVERLELASGPGQEAA